MNGEIINSLRRKLRDREYSEGYAESFLNAFVATQIKVIREQRQMTQADLGECIGTTQAGVSRYENVNYSSWNIKTLIKFARAFHVRLKVSFEPFGTLPEEAAGFSRHALETVSREDDPRLQESDTEQVATEILGEYLARGRANEYLPVKKEPTSIDSHPSFFRGIHESDVVSQGSLGGNYAVSGCQ